MSIPINGHPNRTIKTPPKKKMDPLILSFPKKNRTVLSRPIMRHKPDMNKIYNKNKLYLLLQSKLV
jgi:hypothetical protein